MEYCDKFSRRFFLQRPEGGYSFVYLLISVLWIVWSGRLLGLVVEDPNMVARLQWLHGLLIAVSTLLLYGILKKTSTDGPGGSALTVRQAFPLPFLVLAMLIFSLAIGGGAFALYQTVRNDIARKATAHIATAFAGLNILTALNSALLIILLSFAAWAISIRHRNAIEKHRREVERLALAKRHEILVRHAHDCIIISHPERGIIDVNDRCQDIYGYRREEMLGMADNALLPPGSDQVAALAPMRAGGSEPLRYETNHRRKDGSMVPVEISEVLTEFEGQAQVHRIVRDIAERKANEARIAQLSHLSLTLSAVSHAIAHGTAIEEIFDIACRTCVQEGGFRLAWVGLADRECQRLAIANIWGAGGGCPGGVIDLSPEHPAARTPPAIAFREQRICIGENIADDPIAGAWPGQAAPGRVGASIALPISCDGRPAGVLTAYSDDVASFSPPASNLLGEIAESLSFAMHHFAELAARREAEAALKMREQQLLKAEELAKLGHWEIDLENGHKVWSPQMYRLFERDPALAPATAEEIYTCYYTPDSSRLTQQSAREAIRTGKRISIEQELHFPAASGSRTAYHATLMIPVRNAQNRTIALHGTVQDITEHKMNEVRVAKMASRLAQSAREYEDLYQNAPCGYHSLDKDGVFQRINQTALRWLGYSRDEVIGKMKFSDLLPPDRAAEFEDTFPSALETGRVRDLEQNLICKDGSVLPVLINATVIRDETGQFLMSRSTTYNMSERKRIEQEREEYSRRLMELSRGLLRTQEEDRKRLSASLHDRTSPNLAAIGVNLNVITMSCPKQLSPKLLERLEDIRALLEDTTTSIREISAELRPPLLDYAGLVPTLEGYLYQFSRRTGTATSFEAAQFETRLSAEAETLLFRITQEALTNCAKHADAASVKVKLETRNGTVVLAIDDDGKGFDLDKLGKDGRSVGLGMLNMREMTEFSGGRFTVASRPGNGTAIRVEL